MDNALECPGCGTLLDSEPSSEQQHLQQQGKAQAMDTAALLLLLGISGAAIGLGVWRAISAHSGRAAGNVFVLVGIGLTAFIIWMLKDATRSVNLASARRARSRAWLSSNLPWEELFAKAEATVTKTISDLPPELKAEADKVPCLLRRWPARSYSAWILGHYFGFQRGQLSEYNGPIILYVGTIYCYCWNAKLDFDDQVRMTYLHEFGHHLGWDESDLKERGLL